nr:MAG TPA: hypothetical protein [Caudoviricetes sp.]
MPTPFQVVTLIVDVLRLSSTYAPPPSQLGAMGQINIYFLYRE